MDVDLDQFLLEVGRLALREVDVAIPQEIFAEVKLVELLLLRFLARQDLIHVIVAIRVKETVFEQAVQRFGDDGPLPVPLLSVIVEEFEQDVGPILLVAADVEDIQLIQTV